MNNPGGQASAWPKMPTRRSAVPGKRKIIMSKKYRTAIIGCGKRAVAHVPGMQADPRVEVIAVADVNGDAAQAMSEKFDSKPAVYTDYHELLKKEKPEFVVSCLWTPLHLSVFEDCVKSGVNAYHSEKPMAPTWGECRKMAELAESSGCQLTFSHQRRYCRGNREVRKMIRDGFFGTIKRLDLASPKNLLDCGTHTFDQALSFIGEVPAKWTLAAVDASDTINWFDVKAEIMAVATICFANGIRANIQTGGPDQDMFTGVRVIGDKGFIEVEWDGKFLASAVYADPDWQPPEVVEDKEAAMNAMIKDILDAYENKTEADCDFRKALRAAEIIFACYESVRRHARIELPISIQDNPFLNMLEEGQFPLLR